MTNTTVLLIIDRTKDGAKKFIDGMTKLKGVELIPTMSTNNEAWHLINNALERKATMLLYQIDSKEKLAIEEEIMSISYHFRFQNIYNILRIEIDDSLLRKTW